MVKYHLRVFSLNHNIILGLNFYMIKERKKKILEYANSIVENGMPEGIIMIDDGWSDYYGRWKFNGEKFKNPKGMINKLHELGFKVMLWTCPFITPDTQEFRYLRDRECLVKIKMALFQ